MNDLRTAIQMTVSAAEQMRREEAKLRAAVLSGDIDAILVAAREMFASEEKEYADQRDQSSAGQQ